MFPTSDQTADCSGCDEIASKWKGLLVNALQKVQDQVHKSLTAKEDALEYVESLIFRLLITLCASQPHSVQDVEERVMKTFPHPIDQWAIGDAQNALEKGKKKNHLVLPLDKIHSLLQKEILGYKIEPQVAQYIVAVLEYISADILKLAGNYVKNIRHFEITCQDIKVAMYADKVLMDMFYQDDDVTLNIDDEPISRTSQYSYDEIVKDLIYEERQHIRELNMIVKVFREPFVKLPVQNLDLNQIFSNVMEVHDFSASLLGSFEDALEMAEEMSSPNIGSCFFEMAECSEFDVYEDYARNIMSAQYREQLLSLLHCPDVANSLQTACHGFILRAKYVLPKLIQETATHCFRYFEYIKALKQITASEEDKDSLEQAEGLLEPLKTQLERICGGSSLKKRDAPFGLHSRACRQIALQKINELQKIIDGWEGRDVGQCCNEFVMEGALEKVGSGRKLTERHIFLFDGLMILCKPNNKRSSVTGAAGDYRFKEYRFKESYFMRKIEIIDKEDTEDLKNAFEIAPRDAPHVILFTKTQEEKNIWMANLILLNTKSMLERTLDSILSEEEKKHPLRLPPVELYRFAVEDSESNICFEENKTNAGVPLIKGATLLKLVERLTYHMYADPMFVRTFLTTFRSFCQPQELLDLLIERFDIPDPPVINDMMEIEDPEGCRNSFREDLKRFKKEYSQPVQFRVLNVLRHWVDHHYYDFERDELLLVKLKNFLDQVKGKNMKKWVESINKVVQRKCETQEETREIIFSYDKTPPPIEWYIANPTTTIDKYDVLTLHPIELARQLTLLEFDYYRAVKPSELVNWTKKDKNKTSPNLLKMINHSTTFSFWLEQCIVESKNFEERVAVVSRMLEVMIVLQELNNFTGVFAVASAMSSACVHRLEHTLNKINYNLKKGLDDALDLQSDHCKKYQEKLRSINPPCVPFLGMYLTNILHIEEGNLDLLPNTNELINFSKRRKIAEITGEIQQYQNQPYCLTAQSEIRQFLESLNPQEQRTEKELTDYLYAKSLEIEPRGCKQPPKFPRKWPDLPLKSPGIKPKMSRSSHHTLQLTSESRNMSTTQLNQDDDNQSTATPPTSPSTPLTPSPGDSVFATVDINPASPRPVPLPPITPPPRSPPPLPPRRKPLHSQGECTSPTGRHAPDPFLPPPRDAIPPPIPPRNSTSGVGTFPRRMPPNLTTLPNDLTLPRRNSTHDHSFGMFEGGRRHSQSSLVNGPNHPVPTLPPPLPPPPLPPGGTPELPPRTHRQPLVMNNSVR